MTESQALSDIPSAFTDLVLRFEEMPEESRLVAVYEYVRDIAYGDIGSRNPFDVLAAHKGTCSGKHALLKLLLTELGYDVQSWFATHDFGKFPIQNWPPALEQFHNKHIPDYHDFLKVKSGNEWLSLDAVFDSQLAALGFPALEWDGKTNMQLPVESSDLFPAEGDMEDHKKRLISALSEDDQANRRAFLAAMTAWLDESRKTIPTE